MATQHQIADKEYRILAVMDNKIINYFLIPC